MKYDLGISIVLNHSDQQYLDKTLESISCCMLNYKLYIIDNSSTNYLQSMISIPSVEYIFNNGNIGFGKAHNIALKKSVSECRYHLVLNPDVSFPENSLEKLFDFMERHSDVGLILPKVVDQKGQLQYLAKRLPNAFDLVIRRLNSKLLSQIFRGRLSRYEMREKNYNQIFSAPFLSGCFMFLRSEALEKIGFFDERFFMYMEDVDLSRRMYLHYKNIFFPEVTIFHQHARGSYKNRFLLKIHIQSAIKYFNKWGWMFDPERGRINEK
jgi:GT2 family glycosyltransferase